MTRNEYNGWTNYETWAVSLHLSNTEAVQREVGELLTDPEVSGELEHEKAEALKVWTEEWLEPVRADIMNRRDDAGLLAVDLIGAAFSEVNWLEIARNKME